MTLIVGIVCKDAIVLGSESETSREPAKYQGTHKLHIVPFKNDYAIVGEAGIAHHSSLTLRHFRRIAAETEVQNDDDIRKVAGRAFRQMVSETACPQIGTLEFQDFFRMDTNYFELTIGYYFKGAPNLLVLNPVFGTAASQNRDFSISGIAGYLAEYLLKEFRFCELDSHSAVAVAAHVVNEVKASVMGCGGHTEIALVSSGNRPEKLAPTIIELLDEKLKAFSKTEHDRHMAAFREMLEGDRMQYQGPLTSTIPLED